MKTSTKTSTTTRILLLLLTLAMTVSVFAGCKTQTNGSETDSEGTTAGTQDTGTAEIVPDFEPFDYDTDITILQNDNTNGSINREEWNSEEAENENLEYALIDKIDYLETKYGITFNFRYRTKVDVGGTLSNEIMTNQGTYDIINFPLLQTSTLASQGLLYSLTDVENIDLSKPWWNQQLNEDVAYNGDNFFAVGNSNLTSMWTAGCVFFNKQLAEGVGYNYNSIYQMVTDHTWTLEKLLEISQDAWQEKDGENGKTAGDIFGIAQTAGGWYTAFYGSGIKFVSASDNGDFVLNSVDQTVIDYLEMIIEYENNEEISFVDTKHEGTDTWGKFTNGEALFLVEFIAVSTNAKKSSVDYGILPSPLATAGQTSYYTTIHTGHSSCFAIPTDIWDGDLPMLGKIIEEANYISRKEVWPEMYDTLLKGQIARDPQSADILDVIFDNLSVDCMLIYAPVLDTTIRALIKKGDTSNIKSTLDGVVPNAEAQLLNINNAYKDKIQ